MPVPGNFAAPPPEPPARSPSMRELERPMDEHRRLMRGLTRSGRSPFAGSFLRGFLPLRRRRPLKPLSIRDDATALAFDWHMVGRDMWAAIGQFEDDAAYRQATGRPPRE